MFLVKFNSLPIVKVKDNKIKQNKSETLNQVFEYEERN